MTSQVQKVGLIEITGVLNRHRDNKMSSFPRLPENSLVTIKYLFLLIRSWLRSCSEIAWTTTVKTKPSRLKVILGVVLKVRVSDKQSGPWRLLASDSLYMDSLQDMCAVYLGLEQSKNLISCSSNHPHSNTVNSVARGCINTLSVDWHVLFMWCRVKFCSRAGLQSKTAKSENWARGARLGKKIQAGLMRVQRSFWVKYPARGLHVKHTPQGKREDSNSVPDKINNAGLIRTNADAGDWPHLWWTKETERDLLLCRCFGINLISWVFLSFPVSAVVSTTNKDLPSGV